MKLEEYKKKSHDLTAKASDICRQLNLAGIGILWIIKTSNIQINLSDGEIFIPLFLISISMIFDFLQYLIGGIIWISFYRENERQGISKDTEIKSHRWRSDIIYFIYYFKFIFTFISYGFIIYSLFKHF